MQTRPNVSFQIQPHAQMAGVAVGNWLDLSGNIMLLRRVYDMGVGSFTVQVKLPRDSWEKGAVETYVREGDPVAIRMSSDPSRRGKLLYGFVDSVSKAKVIDANTRGESHVFTISGRGWGRAMLTPILSGAAISARRIVSVPPANSQVKTGDATPQMPGLITADTWAQIMSEVWKAAFQTNGTGTKQSLKRLLQITMNDTWKTPLGEALIDALSWGRFGIRVRGIPWRIIELTMSGNMITPDTILRQIGNESYNEVMYDYDYDNDERPAIVYRPRPYEARDKAATESFEVPIEQLTAVDSTRMGAERFNYFRSNAALMSFNGIEMGIDRKEGKSPVIDRESIERHGLRPIMPQDDFFPPLNADTDLLKYYIQRINKYYGWYANNAEYVSGTVTYKGVIGDAAIGKYVVIPESYQWQGFPYSDKIRAYCVGLTETFKVSPITRAVSLDSAVSFIRGEPPTGLPVKAVNSWVNPIADVEPESTLNPNEYVTAHIKWSDLACNDVQNTPVPEIYRSNAKTIANYAELILAETGGSSIGVTSCYRTVAHNTYVHGESASKHLRAQAIDFYIPGKTLTEISTAITALRARGAIPRGGTKPYPAESPPFMHYQYVGVGVTDL